MDPGLICICGGGMGVGGSGLLTDPHLVCRHRSSLQISAAAQPSLSNRPAGTVIPNGSSALSTFASDGPNKKLSGSFKASLVEPARH